MIGTIEITLKILGEEFLVKSPEVSDPGNQWGEATTGGVVVQMVKES